jgi:hypothetical protein
MAYIEILGSCGQGLKLHEKDGKPTFGVLRVAENEIREGGEEVVVWYTVFVQGELLDFLCAREQGITGARLRVRGRMRAGLRVLGDKVAPDIKVTATEVQVLNYRKDPVPAEANVEGEGNAVEGAGNVAEAGLGLSGSAAGEDAAGSEAAGDAPANDGVAGSEVPNPAADHVPANDDASGGETAGDAPGNKGVADAPAKELPKKPANMTAKQFRDYLVQLEAEEQAKG